MNDNMSDTASCIDPEKQIFDLKQVLEISKSLNSTLDYTILISSILDTCMGQMMVVKAGLFAKKGLDSRNFSLHRNFQGFDLDHTLDYVIPDDHPLITLCLRDYASYTPDELREIPGVLEGLGGLMRLEPSLIVPLKAKGAINGIIVLGERIGEDPFSDYERELVMNIAIFASIAIHNAFLFEMTTTDMMTKLKMKHYFLTVLEERLGSLHEASGPICIVMLDIDFFKKVNDTWGHGCGDLVLKNVAATILETIRSNDVAARYGGEEFVLYLPDSGLPVSLQIAERIRLAVEGTTTLFEGVPVRVTISIGIALHDKTRDASAKDLIERADKALYRSKQEGRNRISVAD